MAMEEDIIYATRLLAPRPQRDVPIDVLRHLADATTTYDEQSSGTAVWTHQASIVLSTGGLNELVAQHAPVIPSRLTGPVMDTPAVSNATVCYAQRAQTLTSILPPIGPSRLSERPTYDYIHNLPSHNGGVPLQDVHASGVYFPDVSLGPRGQYTGMVSYGYTEHDNCLQLTTAGQAPVAAPRSGGWPAHALIPNFQTHSNSMHWEGAHGFMEQFRAAPPLTGTINHREANQGAWLSHIAQESYIPPGFAVPTIDTRSVSYHMAVPVQWLPVAVGMPVNEDSHRPPGVHGRFASEPSYNVPLQAVDHKHAEIIPPRPDTSSMNTTHRAAQKWQAAGRPGEQVALAPDIGERLSARQLQRIARIDKINKSALPSFPLHQAPQSTRSSRADVATQLCQVESYLQVVLLRVKDWLPQRLWFGAEPVQDSRLKGNSLMKALATMLVAFAVFDISDEESEAVAALALRVYVCLSGLCEPSAEFFKSWLIHSAKSHFEAAWQLEVPTSIPNIQDKNLVKESLPRALGAVAFSTHLALSNEIRPSHWFSECVHILIDRVTCIEQLKALSKMTTIGGETLFDATTARDILLELNRGLPKLPELDDAANLWNDQNASALIREIRRFLSNISTSVTVQPQALHGPAASSGSSRSAHSGAIPQTIPAQAYLGGSSTKRQQITPDAHDDDRIAKRIRG